MYWYWADPLTFVSMFLGDRENLMFSFDFKRDPSMIERVLIISLL